MLKSMSELQPQIRLCNSADKVISTSAEDNTNLITNNYVNISSSDKPIAVLYCILARKPVSGVSDQV